MNPESSSETSAQPPAPPETESGQRPEDRQQGIFEQRLKLFTDEFSKVCEREKIGIAIAVVADHKIPEQPLVYVRGNIYNVAKMLAFVLRSLKQQMAVELDV